MCYGRGFGVECDKYSGDERKVTAITDVEDAAVTKTFGGVELLLWVWR